MSKTGSVSPPGPGNAACAQDLVTHLLKLKYIVTVFLGGNEYTASPAVCFKASNTWSSVLLQ